MKGTSLKADKEVGKVWEVILADRGVTITSLLKIAIVAATDAPFAQDLALEMLKSATVNLGEHARGLVTEEDVLQLPKVFQTTYATKIG